MTDFIILARMTAIELFFHCHPDLVPVFVLSGVRSTKSKDLNAKKANLTVRLF